MSSFDMFLGRPVVTSVYLPEWHTTYVPPQERFFEYSEAEYKWLKYFGYGHSFLDKSKPYILERVDEPRRPFLMHPNTLRRLIAAMEPCQ